MKPKPIITCIVVAAAVCLGWVWQNAPTAPSVPQPKPQPTAQQTTASSGLVGKTLHVPSDMSVYGFAESEKSGLQTFITTGYIQGWDAADSFAQGAVGDHEAIDLGGGTVKVVKEDDSFTIMDRVTQETDTVPFCLVYVADADANYWVRCSSIGD